MTTPRPLLHVENLASGYGRIPILRDISLNVMEREIVGILGHNGMGKTTLLKTLMGYLPATAGTVTFDGEVITRMPTHGRNHLGIGYVPQGRGIFPRLSVRDNLRLAFRGGGDAGEDDMLAHTLDEFPRIKPLLDREGGTLSGGEQQILALARCLMGNPRFLLLDEPTEGIQPSIIDEIEAILAGLMKTRGISILLVEQNLDFLSELSHRLLIMERGRIVQEASDVDLDDPASIERFMGLGATR